jgi:hypothetical protein
MRVLLNKKIRLAGGSGVKGFGALEAMNNVEARDIRCFEFCLACCAD